MRWFYGWFRGGMVGGWKGLDGWIRGRMVRLVD